MIRKEIQKGMCLLLAFGLVAVSGADILSEAAAKATLKTKKMSLTVGRSKKITIKGKKKKAKYTFTSSSKKKATVSKTGLVKAKKVGKVTITVKEKYRKKTSKIGKVSVVIQKKKDTNSANVVITSSATPNTSANSTVTSTPTPTANVTATPEPEETPRVTRTPRPTNTPFPEDENMSVPVGFRNRIQDNAGVVEDITYDSTAITEGQIVKRKAKVVLPKGYTTDKKYPVVYMNHGIFGNETSLFGDGTQYVVWNAIANGDAEEMIVVFPNGCANETGQPYYENENGFNLKHYAAYDNFTNDLSQCLMPYINSHYSTLTGRENTAICGFSMGGRVSLQIGFQKQEEFGYVGGFCPAFGIFKYTNNGVTEPGFFTEDVSKDPDMQPFTLKQEYMNNTLVLIAAGPNDSVVRTEPKRYHNALEKNQVPHIYYETMGGDSKSKGGGGHEAPVYQHGAYNFLKRIFKNSDKPSDPEIPEGDVASVDVSKADSAVKDGAAVEVTANTSTGCLDLTLPQFQGAVLKNPALDASGYKKVTITYTSDSDISTYLFDGDITDGLGQTAAGQHEAAVLPASATETTKTYDIGSDFSGNCISAIKFVHVDFANSAAKHLQIKSLVFSK